MDRSDLTNFIKTYSLKTGDFKLASGKQSSYLIDLKMTTLHPEGARLIADAIIHELSAYSTVDAIGGMAVGGVPIVAVVCARSGLFPGFYVRKATKGHGTNMLVDGWLKPGMNVVLLEDVITTGGSILQAVDAVRAAGAQVSEVITVVDRLEGGAANLARHGIALKSLITRTDLDV